MTDSPAALVDIACDYLRAALSGEPLFTSTVLDTYGPERVARGMGTLLVFLVTEAADQTDQTPDAIVGHMRATYSAVGADHDG